MRSAHTQRCHEPKACTSPATALYFPSKRTTTAAARRPQHNTTASGRGKGVGEGRPPRGGGIGVPTPHECLVVYCSKSKRKIMDLGMAVYGVICAGIDNPNCFARSGMVTMRSHVSGESHDPVVAVCRSCLSSLNLVASTSALCSTFSGDVGMYERSWVFDGSLV